jgi:hypothetical protein
MLQSPEYQSLSVNNKVSGMLRDNPSCCVVFTVVLYLLRWKVKQSDPVNSDTVNSLKLSPMVMAVPATLITAQMMTTATKSNTFSYIKC